MAFKVQKTENTGVIYADPTDPDLTIRVRHAAQAKSLGGLQVTNQITEVIANDSFTTAVGENSVQDAISIRVRISGSISNAARKKAILASVTGALNNWVDEDVLVGFNPTIVPPAVA